MSIKLTFQDDEDRNDLSRLVTATPSHIHPANIHAAKSRGREAITNAAEADGVALTMLSDDASVESERRTSVSFGAQFSTIDTPEDERRGDVKGTVPRRTHHLGRSAKRGFFRSGSRRALSGPSTVDLRVLKLPSKAAGNTQSFLQRVSAFEESGRCLR
jgi:hypothetical protein